MGWVNEKEPRQGQHGMSKMVQEDYLANEVESAERVRQAAALMDV